MRSTAPLRVVVLPFVFAFGCASPRPIQEKTEFELRREMQQQITEAKFTQVPIGGIIMYIGDVRSLPVNWVACDGQELPVDRVDPSLRSALPDGRTPKIDAAGAARYIMRVH